jgi:hypothetical protein
VSLRDAAGKIPSAYLGEDASGTLSWDSSSTLG